MVWSCLPFIRSGQNHLAMHSERGKKTRQTEEEVGRQHQGMDRPGVRQVPEGSGEQGKMGKSGCKITCGAPTTLAVKELMMMMNNGTLLFSVTQIICYVLYALQYDFLKDSRNTVQGVRNSAVQNHVTDNTKHTSQNSRHTKAPSRNRRWKWCGNFIFFRKNQREIRQ